MTNSPASHKAPPIAVLPFAVMVNDNFHFMDQDEPWRLGTFATLNQALAVCTNMVESCLADCYKTGMDAKELYSLYMLFGDDPFILGPGDLSEFSAWDYAKARAKDIR